ncbi:protein crumbs isoform X2 [Agrilus planipennis]|uniref:Protein crumbs isoform X2 n=1 Tax=Agrilus planipennis TaxID=224129 RepID=A0A7F5RHN8_AGRPL|nr:protein crumbs isoform X2 [Agrilus planipennis]
MYSKKDYINLTMKFGIPYLGLTLLSLATCDTSAEQNYGPSNRPEAFFNGSSYIRLQTTVSLKKTIGLSFRTCIGGGLFSQKYNDNVIEVSVKSTGVFFEGTTQGNSYETLVSGNFLNNKWHTVKLKYALGNLTISVDEDNTKLIANSSYQSELLTSPGLYYEGAILIVGNHFNGCILEGPSITFHDSVSQPHYVQFGTCPIPYNSCVPREDMKLGRSFDQCNNEPCLRQGKCISKPGSYSCVCHARYTGKNCEIDLGNPCEKTPPVCNNGGKCENDNLGNYVCKCLPGFSGKHCDIEESTHPLCAYVTCLNEGTCHVPPGSNRAECVCPSGFTGTKCENNINDCSPNPCQNNGKCVDGKNNFTCDCSYTGYEGPLCENNVNECRNNPCLNHGTCFDTYGSYICQCLEGFDGKNCQNSINECLSYPCLNHGQCLDKRGGYECQCLPGFAGINCEMELRQSRCDTHSCPAYADCVELSGTYVCVCKKETAGSHSDCIVGLGCLNSPCANGGSCTATKTGFNCSCPPGFTGDQCQVDIDECASDPCMNGGTCMDRVNGFYCNCTENWMGQFCEKPFDICELKPCQNNGSCATTKNKHEFVCTCPRGFEGKKCEINIDDCKGVKCPPGTSCVDLIGNFECQCPLGFTGENCSIDIDPCIRGPCDNNARCMNDPKDKKGYKCICPQGFTGENCETINDACACVHGICINNTGSYQCYCEPGYTGERCNLDFDECLSMPCRNNATCVDKVNNFECICNPGYSGKDCSININECDPMPCTEGSTCIDGINAFTCICVPGLTGRRCEINIDDCESSPCLNGARCIDGLNSYTCDCTDTGFMGDHCEINIDDCIANPCEHGGTCVDEVKDYRCNCYPGYTGKKCEFDIKECDSNPCKYQGTCLEKSNMNYYKPSFVSTLNISLPQAFAKTFDFADAAGYECLCVPGVTGRNCEINIDECDSNPCVNGVCQDRIGGYVCECNPGYEGEICQNDIDECEKYHPCVHGRCNDGVAEYYCDCEPRYGGKNCSVELIGCVENPCLNRGTCKPYLVRENEHKFNCSCPNGFHGPTCENITTMSVSGQSLMTVNTTREEGYDIQFRFRTTLGDGLLALGTGLTYHILELSKGRLNLHSSLLNKWEGVFIGSNLNDSNWQKVFVAINSSHLVLSANEEQTIYPITFNENYNSSSTSFPTTYIGGVPNYLRKLTHGQPPLVGCLEDVLINGIWVLPEMQNVPNMSFLDVEVGCHREPQCSPNPCHSGGHCTDKWRHFSCICERPYLGPTCQYNYTPATFGYENITNSLVTVTAKDQNKRSIRQIVDISMFIRTRQAYGQIFYLGSNPTSNNINLMDVTYIAAQLDNGELLVRIQFNGTPEAYTVGSVKLNDGYLHLIEVIRNVTLVQVKLNGTEYFRKTISATGTLDAPVLYLGGQPQLRPVRQADTTAIITKNEIGPSSAAVSTPLSMINFKGIIQDVQVSDGQKTMVVEFFPLDVPDMERPLEFGEVHFEKSLVLEGVLSDDSCRIQPCKHNGTCVNTWNDYKCECTHGFKGKDCNDLEFCELEHCPDGSTCRNLEDGHECIASVTFDGKSRPYHYTFSLSPSSSPSFLYFERIELSYRTRSWGTALFVKYEENYFVIFVNANVVVIQWNINGDARTRSFEHQQFEGQWLTLLLIIKDSSLIAGFKEQVIDDTAAVSADNFNAENFTEMMVKGSIYVGGSDNKTFDYWGVINMIEMNGTRTKVTTETTTDSIFTSSAIDLPGNVVTTDVPFYSYKADINKNTDYFKGCMGEVRIGHLLVPFFTAEDLYQNGKKPVEYFELEKRWLETDCKLCFNTDCFNDGYCIDPKKTYQCQCQPGFTAEDCSVDINECERNECQNNSTCLDLIAKYECSCLPGYTGQFCEIDIDECESSPCLHGGTCVDMVANFKCECPEEYVGKQCEALRLITCENQPCKEGATCTDGKNYDTGNNFTCVCPEGYVNPLCDMPYCMKKMCEYGYCNITGKPICQCQRGFEGEYCQTNIDDCIGPSGTSPCQNGGVCIDGINRYDCNCTGTGYQGLLCELDIDECSLGEDLCGPGICVNTPGSYVCNCTEGLCGYYCSLMDPCVENPCEHGTCVPACTNVSDYNCRCEENWTGKNCSEPAILAAVRSDGVNILYIVIPIVVLVVIGMVIGLVILVNMARSKRATRGTYSPSAQEFCNPRVELDHVLKPPPEERLI